MTEKQWLRATKSWDRFYDRFMWLRTQRRPARKYRLWGCACCHRLDDLMPDPRSPRAVALAEQFADGTITKTKIVAAKKPAWLAVTERGQLEQQPEQAECWGARAAAILLDLNLGSSAITVAVSVAIALNLARIRSRDDEQLAQTKLMLDIFGNPFRKVKFDKKWRTDTAVALARTMYESHEFSAIPILADALQDAGCDNNDILSHCRSEQTHVRGCWVVDLVLGK
jgi:hypothetical protein